MGTTMGMTATRVCEDWTRIYDGADVPDPDMCWRIPQANMRALEARMAKVAAKCARLGCDFSYEVVGEGVDTFEDGDGRMFRARVAVITARGLAKVDGWELVAALDHRPGGNVLRRVPTPSPAPLDAAWLSAAPICEHCGTRRHRGTTYLVRELATGRVAQVGSTCVMDFTNGLSAEACAALLSSLRMLDGMRDGDAERLMANPAIPTRLFLACAEEATRTIGYRKSADESPTKSVALAWAYALDAPVSSPGDPREALRQMEELGAAPLSDGVSAEVDAMLDWIGGIDPATAGEYLASLHGAASGDWADLRHAGLLASLPSAWRRAEGRRADEEAKAAARAASRWVGEEGARIEVPVRSCRIVTSWDGWYGGRAKTTYLCEIVTGDGDILVWRTSTGVEPFDDGDEPRHLASARVKSHDTYRGTRQTVVTRVSFTGLPGREG